MVGKNHAFAALLAQAADQSRAPLRALDQGSGSVQLTAARWVTGQVLRQDDETAIPVAAVGCLADRLDAAGSRDSTQCPFRKKIRPAAPLSVTDLSISNRIEASQA
jgi:Ser/Thr protein kinase RdoA (MazF antagonist)